MLTEGCTGSHLRVAAGKEQAGHRYSYQVQLDFPALIFVGDEANAAYAKTGLGVVQWRRSQVAGQLRLSPKSVDLGVPDMTLEEAGAAGARSLIIGVASVGGRVPDEWWRTIAAAAASGLDIVSGLHCRLADNPEVAAAADASGARLIDVRVPPTNLPVGTGRPRTGKRILMVGTDCAVGKKYSALALHAELLAAGAKSTFRATGQTGIMIAGEGIPIDSVVADFVSGAAEMLSPDNDADHWDVIEGQGSLLHPGYAAVSLGLLHGSQPDAIVVCHDACRKTVVGWPDYELPSVEAIMSMSILLGKRINPNVKCVGVSINTSGLPPADRSPYMRSLSGRLDLPCVDPIRDGCRDIARAVLG